MAKEFSTHLQQFNHHVSNVHIKVYTIKKNLVIVDYHCFRNLYGLEILRYLEWSKSTNIKRYMCQMYDFVVTHTFKISTTIYLSITLSHSSATFLQNF